MKTFHWIYIIALFVLFGCNGGSPQIPSRRMGESPKVDSASLALMELNQRLAVAADDQLLQYVQTLDEPYAIYTANAWMHIINRGEDNGATPKSGEEWTISMRTYNLEGKLLVDSEGSYHVGKHELPLAVDANIGELRRGGKARMIVPWYAAYGLQGTDEIPPYENVIIEIELK